MSAEIINLWQVMQRREAKRILEAARRQKEDQDRRIDRFMAKLLGPVPAEIYGNPSEFIPGWEPDEFDPESA